MGDLFFDLQRFTNLTNNNSYSVVGGSYVNDNITNWGNYSTIYGYNGDDYLVNAWSTSGVRLYGGFDDDTIKNYGGQSYLSGDFGDDLIQNGIDSNYGHIVTIDGGFGDDTIENNKNFVSINGGFGDDRISLSGAVYSNTVVGDFGNDVIYGYSGSNYGVLYQYNSVVDGYDTIYNWNSNDTLSLGSGIYYTRNTVNSNVLISIQGGGAVTLSGASSKSVNIKGGTLITPSLILNNYNQNSVISGSNGADTIRNYAGGAKIYGNAGNDSIYNSTNSSYTINGCYGYVTIDGGAGNDNIYSYDPRTSIQGGAGDDKITLYGNCFDITVIGGAGSDTVYTDTSRTNGVLFNYNSGDGLDYITNWSSYDTLNFSSSISYSKKIDGSNVIVSIQGGGAITLGGGSDKTINIQGGNDLDKISKGKFISNSTSNTVLKGTAYADTINNSYAGNVTINAGKGNDSIYNWADKVTVNGGKGKDTLSGGYSNSNINGDAGNDLITLTGAYWRNTIDGGADKDTIIAGGNEHSVFGGAGADSISLSGDKLTVNGGAGNDTIYGSTSTSHLYQYGKGDGSDIIYNWSSNDTLTITGGASWTKSNSGSDVIIIVKDSGKITLSGAKGKTVNVYPTENPTPTPTAKVTPQDVIKKFMKSLDTTNYSGISAVSQAVSVATGGYFPNVAAAIEQMTLDCQSAGNVTNFLKTYCDIDLSNDDTGAITGYDAGGSTTQKTAKSIVPESNNLNNFTGSSFTTDNGLTVKLGSIPYDGRYVYTPSDLSYSSIKNNSTKNYIWQAFQTWWADDALNLIADSYGSNYGFTSKSSATTKTMYFGFFDEAPDSNGGVTMAWTAMPGGVLVMAPNINSKVYGSLTNGGNPDGQNTSGYSYLDRVLAHEMTHAVMMTNINYFGDLPHFISEGMAELTHGADDDRKDEITALAKNPSSLSRALNNDCYDSYAGGYMFLRYLAKQGAEHYPTSSKTGYAAAGSRSVSKSSSSGGNSSTVSIKSGLMAVSKDFEDDMLDLTTYASSVKKVDATALTRGIMIIGNQKANSISAGAGADTISANTGNDTVLGGAGNDLLYGDAGNDKLYGNDGNDSISGGSGNDTLIGGAGKDVFIHKADNDFIYDYVAGEDKIKLVEEYVSITAASLNGSDVVLTVGNGSITVKDGKDKKITVVDYDGKSTSSVYGGGKNLTLNDKSKAAVTLGSDYQNANASKRTVAIKITGNALDNTILGGKKNDSLYGAAGNDSLAGNAGNDKLYGGKGNDSLWGGAGNDSLWGGDGKDNFIYKPGEGTDKIFDYASDDLLTILKSNGKAGGTFTSSSFKNSTLTLAIDGGGKVVFDGVATGDKFNINGTSHTIKGKKLVVSD